MELTPGNNNTSVACPAWQQNEGTRRHCPVIPNQGEQIHDIKENRWEFYPVSLVESSNGLPSPLLFKAIIYLNNRRLAKNTGLCRTGTGQVFRPPGWKSGNERSLAGSRGPERGEDGSGSVEVQALGKTGKMDKFRSKLL